MIKLIHKDVNYRDSVEISLKKQCVLDALFHDIKETEEEKALKKYRYNHNKMAINPAPHCFLKKPNGHEIYFEIKA